ncbi:MAG: hypothetical protein J5544_00885 [Clostridia bacterium]|nr:hypothetical protein [Clostridia bacterium]
MKKALSVKLFALFLAALFVCAGAAGCGRGNDGPAPTEQASLSTDVPVTEPPATENPVTEIPATEEPAEEMPYKGDGKKYVFTTAEGTTGRLFEEDVVQFADDFLDKYNGHPLLTDRETSVGIYNENTLGGSDTELRNMLDPELREEFIRRINGIILDIPNIDSAETLAMRLAETAAILHDVHSNLFPISRYELPIEVMPIHTENGYELYITATPKGELESALLARIDRINGFLIEDCVRRIAKLISYESETWLYYLALDGRTSKGVYPFILDCGILQYCGIMKDAAILEVTQPDGSKWTVTLYPTQRFSYEKVYYRTETGAEESDIGLDLMFSVPRLDLSGHSEPIPSEWCALLNDHETIYFRFNECTQEPTMPELLMRFDIIMSQVDHVKRIIMDFRCNGGGYSTLYGYSYEFINKLREANAEEGIFVLIDYGSCSAATILPSHLIRVLDNAKLVGSPSAQPTSFFTGLYSTLKNTGYSYAHSKRFGYYWPGNEDPALTPDIIVYQTFEDLQNGVDTVLKSIIGEAIGGIKPM